MQKEKNSCAQEHFLYQRIEKQSQNATGDKNIIGIHAQKIPKD